MQLRVDTKTREIDSFRSDFGVTTNLTEKALTRAISNATGTFYIESHWGEKTAETANRYK
jgi:hypothetical protein